MLPQVGKMFTEKFGKFCQQKREIKKKKVEFTPSKKGDESLICGICGTPSGGICYFVRKKCSAIHESQQLTSHMGVLSLKLPPPPCAVLLTTKTGI
jgi:hypothetical protein